MFALAALQIQQERTAMESGKWRSSVRVVRADEQAKARLAGTGRATAFDFDGTGGSRTWVDTVTFPPLGMTEAHHHGRHEVAVFVATGRSRIRWGDRLEFAAEARPGDMVYFAPYVPHQEFNPDARDAVEFVVIRSDNEGTFVGLDIEPAERPEIVF
jgi:uncharacterized RmlC-like cupin family protein